MIKGVIRLGLAISVSAAGILLMGAGGRGTAGGGAAAAAVAVTVDNGPKWKIEPDVAKGALAGSAATKPTAAQISADPFQTKTGISMTLNVVTSRVAGSRQGGWHILLPYSNSIDLFNLKTGQKERTLANVGGSDYVLSPEGDWFTFVRNNVVETWSMKTGKAGIQIKRTDEERLAGLSVLGFVGPTRIAVYRIMNNQKQVKAYDVTNGQVAASLAVGADLNSSTAFLSANGEILAASEGRSLVFYQLLKGQKLGQISLEKPQVQLYNPRVVRDIDGAFSPDGREFAAIVYYTDGVSYLMLISAETGEVKVNQTVNCRYDSAGSARLAWSPNGELLLMKTSVIDKKTGNVLKDFDGVNEYLFSRWENSTNILFVGRKSPGIALSTVQLPINELQKSADLYAMGGIQADQSLPPLSAIDSNNMATVSVLTGAISPWLVRPKTILPGGEVAGTLSLPALSEAAARGTAARGGAADAGAAPLIFFTPARNNGALVVRNASSQKQVELYGLGDGKKRGAVKLANGRVTDVSDTGEFFIAVTDETKNPRIDVYRLEKSEYKPFMALRPFKGEEQSAAGQTSAVFVDDSHVLLLYNQKLTMFDLAKKSAVWNSDQTPITKIVVSPDRALFCALIKGNVGFFDPLSGKGINALVVSNSSQIAFSADGTLMAALSGAQISIHNLKDGRQSIVFPLFSQGGELRFLSSSHLLVHQTVYSLDQKLPMWAYENIMAPAGALDSRETSFFVISSDAGGQCVVGNAPLPHTKTPILTADDFYAWKTPQTVSLNVRVTGDDKYLQQEIQKWTQQLAGMGITVDPKSPNTLSAASGYEMVNAGEYEFQNKGQSATLYKPANTYSISLSAGNQEVWSVRSPPAQEMHGERLIRLTLQPGETPQQAMDRLNPPPKQVSIIQMPPREILKKNVAIPKFKLTADGPERSK